MPWLNALSDAEQLRRCIRDLVALSSLPAVWKQYDPQQIIDSVAAALVSMLDLAFVYVSINGRYGGPAIEATRVGDGTASGRTSAIPMAMRQRLPTLKFEQTAEIPDPRGEGTVRITSAAIGFGGDGILVAASRSAKFPTEVQWLLLGMATNQATIAVHRWHAETDERRFAMLVRNSSDFIGFASLDGAPKYLNPAGLNLVGLDSLEEAPPHVLDFITPEERRRAQEIWPIVMGEGRWMGEFNFRFFKTGATVPFLVDWFRIDDPRTGQPMNVAIVSRDLTSQKRYEAQLLHLNETLEQRVIERTAELAAVNRRLVAEVEERQRGDARFRELQLELFHAARLSAAGQMAAALAHELNQPLTAATNFVNAARRRLARGDAETSDMILEDMDDAVRQTLRAGQIIRRLREFASRGQTEQRSESVVKLTDEASAFALTGAAELGVQVRFRLDPDATRVLADRIQIQQVLVNLMRNALEAMTGSARQELYVLATRLDEATVEIAVADTGPGLPRAVADRLFQPFVSTKRHGMGLGLSISRTIVESHGGSITAGSNPEGGTTFRFTLTAAPADGENDGQ